MTQHQNIINDIIELLNSGELTWTWHSTKPRVLPIEKVDEMAQTLDAHSWTSRTINKVITSELTAEYYKKHNEPEYHLVVDYADELAKQVLKKDYSPLKFKIS